MSLPSLQRSGSHLPKTKHFYTASSIDRAPSRPAITHQQSSKVIHHVSISGIEQDDQLFQEVFLNFDHLYGSKHSKKSKVKNPKNKNSDFFYQLLYADPPNLDASLKDLLCIAELGIPQGDLRKEANICISLGDKYSQFNKTLSSIRFFKRALLDFSQLKDLKGKSIALNRLSIAYFTRGKYFKAKNMIKKHKVICDEDFVPIYNLGIVHRALGQFKSSIRCFLNSLSVASSKENREELCFANAQLGLTYKAIEEFELAKLSFAKASKIAKSLKAVDILAEIKIALGYLCYYEGKYTECKKHFFSGMIHSTGNKSEICRINIGIIKGEEKIKENFESYCLDINK
jgi:tetratricopeptide (TPR) repeat protein